MQSIWKCKHWVWCTNQIPWPLIFCLDWFFDILANSQGYNPRFEHNGRWGLHAVLQGWLGWHFGQHDHTKPPKWEYQFFVSNLLIVGQLPRTHTIWGLAISCHRFRLMKGILARSILRLKHTVKKLQMKREKSIKWFSFGHLSWITKKSVCQHGNKPNQNSAMEVPFWRHGMPFQARRGEDARL